MIDPDMVPNGPNQFLVMPPQVVADVEYVFTPTFPLLFGRSYTFYASASFPAPIGDNDQQILFNQTASPANTVEVCLNNGIGTM
jgi:hypothetical protein